MAPRLICGLLACVVCAWLVSCRLPKVSPQLKLSVQWRARCAYKATWKNWLILLGCATFVFCQVVSSDAWFHQCVVGYRSGGAHKCVECDAARVVVECRVGQALSRFGDQSTAVEWQLHSDVSEWTHCPFFEKPFRFWKNPCVFNQNYTCQNFKTTLFNPLFLPNDLANYFTLRHCDPSLWWPRFVWCLPNCL